MNSLKNIRKKQKGITLVALVVTIVILLILAGITLIFAYGENGIINKSMTAKEATRKGEATDIINLKITNIQIDSFAKTQKMPTLQYLADSFCEDNEIEYVELESKNIASLEKINVGENKSIFTKLKQYPYEFEINSSLQLASINGVKIAENNSTENNQKIEELNNTIENLNSTIEQMQQKIATLEQNQTSMSNEVNNLKSTMSTSETVFDGNADTTGTTYTVKDISKYDYLIVYTDVITTSGIRVGISSTLINVKDIVYNETNDTKKGNTIYITSESSNNNVKYIAFWFKNTTSFYIRNIESNGGWSSPRIYKIEGIKK